MYDGYIEGNPALNKSIDKIAEFARLYTKRETQYERIYLQSLSEDAIRNGETDLILTIDPNGGVVKELVDPYTERYVNHTEIYEVYLNYVNNNTYDLTDLITGGVDTMNIVYTSGGNGEDAITLVLTYDANTRKFFDGGADVTNIINQRLTT